MSDKPYYEQEYHAPESDIPDPSVGEIFKGLFLYPSLGQRVVLEKLFGLHLLFSSY